MDLHFATPSLSVRTSTRCVTRATIPRISGRSGRTTVRPILPSPSARKVPRCFGLVPIPERTCLICTVPSAALAGRLVRATLVPATLVPATLAAGTFAAVAFAAVAFAAGTFAGASVAAAIRQPRTVHAARVGLPGRRGAHQRALPLPE